MATKTTTYIVCDICGKKIDETACSVSIEFSRNFRPDDLELQDVCVECRDRILEACDPYNWNLIERPLVKKDETQKDPKESDEPDFGGFYLGFNQRDRYFCWKSSKSSRELGPVGAFMSDDDDAEAVSILRSLGVPNPGDFRGSLSEAQQILFDLNKELRKWWVANR